VRAILGDPRDVVERPNVSRNILKTYPFRMTTFSARASKKMFPKSGGKRGGVRGLW